MKKGEKLYEGKAKVLFATDDPDHLIIYFKDDATAFDGLKKDTIEGKGGLNARISELMFNYLGRHGVESHFVRMIDPRHMLVKKVEIVPVEMVVRNFAAGSICKRLGIQEKTPFEPPMWETFYKNDELHDPLITDEHIRVMNLARPQEIEEMKRQTLLVNRLMRERFDEMGITLVDFKLEFGRHKGKILLADEITPDGARLWDKKTGEVLDKDRFRKDLGDLRTGYREILKRLEEKGQRR